MSTFPDDADSKDEARTLPLSMLTSGVSITAPMTVSSSATQHTLHRKGGGERQYEAVADDDSGSEAASAIRQLREQMARQQQLINELLAERNVSTAADALRTPISTSFKRSFSTAAQRSLYNVRPSVHRTDINALSGDAEAEYEEERVSRVVGIAGMQFKDVLTAMKGYVLPFYADSSKDNGRTVLMFVENVESVMGNLLLDGRSPHRLMLVQLCLRDGALAWMNRKLQELTDAEGEVRDFGRQPLSWDGDLRRPFIQAHLGTDTPELWLTKLRMLRLGGEKTKTPIELDNQFDMIARHVFPTMVAGDERSDLLLATYYRDIVAASRPWMYKNIIRSQLGIPRTLKRWKEAFGNAVLAEAHIDALSESKPSKPTDTRGGQRGGPNGGRGYGHKGGHSAAGDTKQQSVSAMGANDNTREEGQPDPNEESSDTQQLTAFTSNRGGRGGRGGGGSGTPFSPERQQLYDERRCFRCKAVGHTIAVCPQPPTPHKSKGQAGQ